MRRYLLLIPGLLLILLPLGGILASISGNAASGAFSAGVAPVLQSLGVGAMAAATSFGFGVPAAIFFARTRFRGRGVLVASMLGPLAVPPYIAAYAWSAASAPGEPLVFLAPLFRGSLLGGGNLAILGTGLVLGLWGTPVVAILAAAAQAEVDPSFEESLRVHGSEWTALRAALLPAILPGAAAGAALVAALAAGSYTAPSIFGLNTSGTAALAVLSETGSVRAVAAASLPILAVALLVLFAFRVRRGGALASWRTGARRSTPPYSRAPAVLLPVLLLYLGLAAGVPLLVLLEMSGPEPRVFLQALTLAGRPLAGGFAVAALAATLAVLCGSLCAFAFARMNRWGGLVLEALLLVPFVAPAFLTGSGWISVLQGSRLEAFYLGPGRMVAATATMCLFPAYLAARAALGTVGPDVVAAAALHGASGARMIRDIYVPLVWRDLAAAGILLIVLAAGEPGMAILHPPPGFETIGILLFNDMHYGRQAAAAALSVVVVAVQAGLLGGLLALGTRDGILGAVWAGKEG